MSETKNQWKKKFIMVALGQAVSLLGSHGVQFALIWWLAERTASPLMLGISGLAAYLPVTLFSPAAGIAADRFNRKWISIFSDLTMGAAALIYAALLLFFDLPVWTVLVMLCLRGIGSTFQQPAVQSMIPQLVPKDQLVKANGWIQLLNSGSFLLGPVIGASLYAVFPISVVLLSDVAGAILASAALAAVKIPKLKREKGEKQHFISEIKEGILVFGEDKKLLHIVTAQALCMFFYAPLSAFYPLMTSDYFNLSAMYGSAVELSFAAGMMAASLLFSGVWKAERKLRVSFMGLLGMGAASVLCRAGSGGKCSSDPADRIYAGNCGAGKDGTGFFRAPADFIGNHAGGPAFQQSDRGKSGCQHLVSDFGTQHDGAYYCCHHSLCHQIPEKKSGIECRDKEPHDRIDAVFF